jgi:hypothetical protein
MFEEITEETPKETRLLLFVSSFLNSNKNLSDDYKNNLSNKICKKQQSYKHSEKSTEFLTMYVQYYLAGYLDNREFDQIISDGTFHILEYEPSKNFFIEVYFGNYFLIKKFEQEMSIYAFSNQESKTMYIDWLEENFKICYDQYHKDPVN